MTWTVVLDPPAVASNRTSFDLNTDPIRVDQAGIDWGDAAITAYMAEMMVGSVPVSFIIPNRIVKIPLMVHDNEGGSSVYEAARDQLFEKVGLMQREGGWLQRGSRYADVVDATLTYPDVHGEVADLENGVVLQLECLPDFYGDEVTLDTITTGFDGIARAVLEQSGVQAVVAGNHPGRVRIVVEDTSGHDQLGVLWGLRSRHYDSASTAALKYEADALTPLNGAAATSVAGASGGNAVKLSNIPAGSWVSMLSTDLAAGSKLTHQGSYRVYARTLGSTVGPKMRLVWGVGGMQSPTINPETSWLPGVGGQPSNEWYLMDLGVIRLDAPPVGPMQWSGQVQVYDTTPGRDLAIDQLIFLPLDEAAGHVNAAQPSPQAATGAVGSTSYPQAAADNGAVGTAAWSNPTNIEAADGQTADVTLASSGDVSHYLTASAFGFSIPSTATITGIEVSVLRNCSLHAPPIGPYTPAIGDSAVRLIKAGTIQTPDKSGQAAWPTTGNAQAAVYGGPTDLWGGAWTPADINDVGFGFAHSVKALYTMAGGVWATVDNVVVVVYYTLPGGVPVVADAVIYANETAELRTEGMYRSDAAGSVYSPIAEVVGDLPRIPSSGLESRPVELIVKTSQGFITNDGSHMQGSSNVGGTPSPDAGLDGCQVTVKYRPSYLFAT